MSFEVGLLLHIYQPPTQFPEVTEDIARTSYQEIVRLLRENSRVKITLNINASLTEQLEKLGFNDFLSDLSSLSTSGRLELTSSAKYHPLLAKLPPREIERQIKLNDQTNARLLGDSYRPVGFFPPEMSYTFHVGRVLEKLGFSWTILEDHAFPEGLEREHDGIYTIRGTRLKVLFRDRGVSLGVAFGNIKSVQEFTHALGDVGGRREYRIVAMDGETFGHHHQDTLDLLEALFKEPSFTWATMSELIERYPEKQAVDILPSTWGQMEVGSGGKRIFPRWNNPENPIHQLQWQLFYLALAVFSRCDPDQEGYLEAREIMDKAVHSDQFFWAAHNPCWHLGMLERGAQLLKRAVEECPASFNEEKERAQKLYREVVSKGEELYGRSVVLG